MPTTAVNLVEIGIEEDAREGLVKLLNTLLADEVTLYQKTRNYHWNVVGPQFHSLHKFLEEQYNRLADLSDEVAEWARMFGGKATGTLQEFVKTRRLKEQPGDYPSAEHMLANLLADHQAVIQSLRPDIDRAQDEFHAMDAADFLTGVLEAHEKMAWMLRAHLEK